MSLDLTPGHGNLLGEYEWEILSPWLSESWTLNTGVSPREGRACSLSQILEDSPPQKYYLSRKACLGILRRARERGKPLPPQLEAALKAQAGLTVYPMPLPNSGDVTAFQANQRDEIRDLHDVAGADGCGGRNRAGLLFAAGFCAGAGPSAGGIGYQEEVAPTLKGTASGNMMPSIFFLNRQKGAPTQTQRSGSCGERRRSEMSEPSPSGGGEGYRACDNAMMPSVLCLNDQGGQIMELSEDISGTLRAQEHGHQPLVLYENHGIDSRYTGPHDVAPTLSARAGTGGNNLPLLSVELFERQRCGKFEACVTASAQGDRQYKDATDLAYQAGAPTRAQRSGSRGERRSSGMSELPPIGGSEGYAACNDDGTLTTSDSKGPNAQYVSSDKLGVETPLLIRRLTPRECERLQGFPDDWTALPGAADSPRYRALGNSVAIPCVEFLMRGMALALLAG